MYTLLVEKQNFVRVKNKCRVCYIFNVMSENGRNSFALSGMPTTKRQWNAIEKFSKFSKISN